MNWSPHRLKQLIVGKDWRLTRVAFLSAGTLGLFGAWVSYLASRGVVTQSEPGVFFWMTQTLHLAPFWEPQVDTMMWVYGYVLVGGIALIHAFFNEGYLPTLVLALSPVYGADLWLVPLTEASVAFAPVQAVLESAIPEGWIVATLGFVVGVALRQKDSLYSIRVALLPEISN